MSGQLGRRGIRRGRCRWEEIICGEPVIIDELLMLVQDAVGYWLR